MYKIAVCYPCVQTSCSVLGLLYTYVHCVTIHDSVIYIIITYTYHDSKMNVQFRKFQFQLTLAFFFHSDILREAVAGHPSI